ILTSTLSVSFRVVALNTKNARTFGLLFNGTILLMTLLLMFFFGVGRIELNGWAFFLLILSGAGYGLFQRYQFTVRKHISAPELQILLTPTGAAGYLLAIFWL